MSSVSAPTDRTTIMLLSLDHDVFFDEMYSGFLTRLVARAQVIRVRRPESAIRYLQLTTPSSQSQSPSSKTFPAQALISTVLVTNAAVMKYQDVWHALLAYVRELGGTCLFMGLFSSFVTPPDMSRYFAEAGLPWKAGRYARLDFQLNPYVARLLRKIPALTATAKGKPTTATATTTVTVEPFTASTPETASASLAVPSPPATSAASPVDARDMVTWPGEVLLSHQDTQSATIPHFPYVHITTDPSSATSSASSAGKKKTVAPFLHSVQSKLAQTYSAKALQVTNVRVRDAWYHAEPFPVWAAPDHTVTESPMALAPVGRGLLGYVGDVNNEAETEVAVLAMCGIL